MDTWEFWHYPNFDDLSPEVCIKYFDFTVNSCAIDSNLKFYYCDSFFDDNENKDLVYTGNHYNLSNGRHTTCINRLNRYTEKGFNIKNLNYIFFASGGKAKIKILQSIGRGLRLHKNKNKLVIIDIADQLRYGESHSEKRLNLYQQENINLKITDIYEKS